MITKWFSEKQVHGGIRYRLHIFDPDTSAWCLSPYFIDSAPNIAHYTYGKKYGLYGSGMGDRGTFVFHRIAACFGGFDRLSETKKVAEQRLISSP